MCPTACNGVRASPTACLCLSHRQATAATREVSELNQQITRLQREHDA
jgi:hypothetical protein